MSYRTLLTSLLTVTLVLGACSDDDDGVARPNAATNAATADAGTDVGEEDTGAPEEDMAPAGPGDLVIEPSLITFSDVRIGETVTAEIVLSNLGESDIVVTRVQVSELDRSGDPEFTQGARWIDGTTIIEPGTFAAVEVDYTPSDNETDRGIVEISSNDPETPMVTVRLETVSAYADLEAPRFVRFGEVTPGESVSQRVIIYNRGIDVLQVSDIVVSQNPGRYAVEFLPTDPVPVSLSQGQDFQFNVVYSPNNDQLHLGTIEIASNDPDQPAYEIGLTGNNPSPCIVTEPRVIDFGEVESGASSTETVNIFNCGTVRNLELSAIGVADDAGGALTIANLPTLPVVVSPLQTETFEVTMSFAEPGLRIGQVEITSDSDNSPLTLEVRATVPEAQ